MTDRSKTGRYHIGIVSKMTGISTHTIRVWERRYGAVEPQRSAGGTREYSDADLDKLLVLRALTDAGHAIGQVARMNIDELNASLDLARQRGLVDEAAAGPEANVVAEFLSAIADMDVSRAERVLVDAASMISPLAMVFDIIAPVVQQVGDRWESGAFRIANEHAATAVLRTFLGAFLAGQVRRPDAPCGVVATLADEQHELGALMAAFVAITRGWNVTYLGANLPNDEICHVVEEGKAELLLLSLVNDYSEASAQRLRALRASLPEQTRVVAGGRSAASYAEMLAADERVTSLRGLHQKLSLRRFVVEDTADAGVQDNPDPQ